MPQLLKWSDVDSNIQTEMGNQSPSESKRLEEINNIVRILKNKFDITTSRRTVEISVIPNGTPYVVAELQDSSATDVMTDDDLKKIDSITPDDDDLRDFQWVEKNKFFRNIKRGINADEYTTYWKNGKLYFAMNSQDGETVAVTYAMDYFSTFLAIDSNDVFLDEVTAVSTTRILLPTSHKDLVVAGVIRRLLYPSLGDEGNTEYNKKSTLYKNEIKALGLSSVTKPLKREERKVKIHNPY